MYQRYSDTLRRMVTKLKRMLPEQVLFGEIAEKCYSHKTLGGKACSLD